MDNDTIPDEQINQTAELRFKALDDAAPEEQAAEPTGELTPEQVARRAAESTEDVAVCIVNECDNLDTLSAINKLSTNAKVKVAAMKRMSLLKKSAAEPGKSVEPTGAQPASKEQSTEGKSDAVDADVKSSATNNPSTSSSVEKPTEKATPVASNTSEKPTATVSTASPSEGNESSAPAPAAAQSTQPTSGGNSYTFSGQGKKTTGALRKVKHDKAVAMIEKFKTVGNLSDSVESLVARYANGMKLEDLSDDELQRLSNGFKECIDGSKGEPNF
jgi:hypothetical protein